MTRKSTRKFQVVHLASGTICVSDISKTEATKIAREMSGDRKGTVIARPHRCNHFPGQTECEWCR